MRTSRISFALAAAVAMTTALTGSAHAQSTPTEQDIIDALKPCRTLRSSTYST